MKLFFDSEQLYKKIENMNMLHWILFLLAAITIGFIINTISPYPWFYRIIFVMCAISTIAISSERRFIKDFNEILGLISGFNSEASLLIGWSKRFQKSKFIYYYSGVIILYFGIIGLLLLNNYPSIISLIYILIFFIITVFISMIGYIQYIFLALFMIKLSKIPKPPKRHFAHVPSETDWIVKINGLVGFYTMAFFVLSMIYIVAVYFFCFSPQFGVMTNGLTMFVKIVLSLCWGLISLAIGLVLPAVYTIEYRLLKTYIGQVKNKRIEAICEDLKKERVNKYSVESVLIMIKLSPDKPQANYVTNIASFIIWLGSTIGSIQAFYDIISTSIT